MKQYLTSSLLGLVFVCSASATDTETETKQTETNHASISVNNVHLDQSGPDFWGLTQEEWSRYHELMQGPQGRWTPNEDPTFVLGLQARSEQERKRYARLQVDVEKRRTEQGLAFALAYSQAWNEMYPNLDVIDMSKVEAARKQRELKQSLFNQPSSFSGFDLAADVIPHDRFVVFVEPSCGDCRKRVKDLIGRTLTIDGAGVDLFFLNMSDQQITQWGMSISLSEELVNHKAKKVTLRRGDGGLLKQLAVALKQEPTTYYRRRGQKYQPLAF